MRSDTPLDYALFQLSPKRSRCELFVSHDGNIEKLASGLLKPFVAHLKIAEEQVALAAQSIKLEADNYRNGETWFTKGTLERFVRFVSTPEVLEMVNTFDAEMSQLEAARVIYAQGAEGHLSSKSRKDGSGATTAADATKKELLRAIDVRLAAVKQDLATASSRAAAAGFNHDTVPELQTFADQFGAYRLNDACSKFISLCERRPDLINSWKSGVDDRIVRSSYGSDMSIDDEPITEKRSQKPDPERQQSFEQLKASSCQQLNSSSIVVPLRSARESSTERDDTSSLREKKEEGGSSEVEPPATQPTLSRRLSVQDRISLFENKQKETSTGSGGKSVVAKSAELRRLPSDVSSGAAEKAVLRRWSGVSDMSISIDLSSEKKEIDDLACTPATTSAMKAKPDDRKNLHSTANSDKPEFRSIPGIVSEVGSKDQRFSVREDGGTVKSVLSPVVPLTVSSGSAEDAYQSEKSVSVSEAAKTQDKSQSSSSVSHTGIKDQTASESHTRSFPFDRADRFGFKDQGRSKGSYIIDEQWETIEQGGTIDQLTSEIQIARLKEDGSPQMKAVTFASKSGNNVAVKEQYQPSGTENLVREEDYGSTLQSAPLSRLRTPHTTGMESRQLDSNSGSKIREAFSAQQRMSLGSSLSSQSSTKSVKQIEEVEKQPLVSSEKQYASPILNIEDSGIPKVAFQKQVSARDHTRKSQSRRSDSNSIYKTNRTLLSGKMVSDDPEDFTSDPQTPTEQVQRIRQTKGNQELNDELKMKANELEKLFAEHKLRAPGDQSNSTRRSKPNNLQSEHASSSLPNIKQVVAHNAPHILDIDTADSLGSLSSVVKLSDGSVKSADNQDYGDNVNYNISNFGLLDESRGKFYDTYMLKRDAKLREEWGTRRTEKEAKLKEMQDSFERNRSELRDKLSGSNDKNDSVHSARRRAERLRSFNNRSTLKIEQPDFLQSEDDEDPSELAEQKSFGQDRSTSDAYLGNGASKSSQIKRLLPNRNFSSSTHRTSAAAVPRSTTKASNSGSTRRRTQSENPLMQSVPNFSDLRKENTKPYSASKIARPQVRNHTRSRSINEEIPHAKEEKARRSQSVKKTTANPAESKDTSPLNTEIFDLSPRKFDIGREEQSRYDKFVRGSKPLLQKNNSIGHGSGAGDVKLRASMNFTPTDNDEESDELGLDPEDSAAIVKDGEEILTRAAVDHVSMDHRELSVSQESAKLNTSGSENGDVMQSSLVDASSTLHAVSPVQESPGESPMSWSSRVHHPFSYPHEGSDIDASIDSPMGSPASWSLHPLNQTEADAARMRKKWGSAQKPVIGSNLSSNQSRKDVTKGFKRLLKFGRKSRGTESLADWISATTSEGDDDTEDGRDLSNRLSEDLRKSRMGFAHDQASEEGIHESDFFNEQALSSSIPAPPANFRLREDHLSGSSIKAPRSFFSLSTFRSKGSESKLR